jgi:pyruvate/2-oxoglutarate dehydrogenase complex dihydrolipoamide acyltransferase (E2) component
MTRLRLRVAERLKGAQNTYAMLTTFNEVDMTGLMEMRNAYKVGYVDRFEQQYNRLNCQLQVASSTHLLPFSMAHKVRKIFCVEVTVHTSWAASTQL